MSSITESVFEELFAQFVPRDLDAETGILGRWMLDSRLPLTLSAEHFFDPRHQAIYRLLEDLRAAGPHDGQTDLFAFLARRDQIARVQACGWVAYVRRLAQTAASITEIDYCLRRIVEMWRRRLLAHRLQTAAQLAGRSDTPYEDLIAQADIHRIPELVDAPREGRFRLFTAAELNSGRFETRYLIPGLLAAGQPGGIFGAFKTLKTSLTADLLISLASGTPFLGQFPVTEPCPVMFLSGESGLAALQSIARRIGTGRGLSLESLEHFELSPDLPHLDRPSDVLALRRIVRERQLKCLAIDPAYLALGSADVRNLFSMGGLLRPLAELGEETGCTVLIVHHCKRTKHIPRDPATLDDVAWSGFAEFSAQWLLLARRTRFDPDTGHHELWLSTGGRAGHHGLWALDVEEGCLDNSAGRQWKTTVHPASAAHRQLAERMIEAEDNRRSRRTAAAFKRHRERALEFLSERPEGATTRHVRDALRLNGERVGWVLNSLVEDGLVVVSEREKFNRPEFWYFLPAVAKDSLSAERNEECDRYAEPERSASVGQVTFS